MLIFTCVALLCLNHEDKYLIRPLGPSGASKRTPPKFRGGVTGHGLLRRKVHFGAEVTGHTQRRIDYLTTVLFGLMAY
jgi:hypothetical protein